METEIGRAVAQDVSSDTILISLCDTKLVWHYLKNGFVNSPFLIHLPQQFRTRPTEDRLPATYEPFPSPTVRKLDDVMTETLRYLEGNATQGREELSPTLNEVSIDSSMMMSSPRAASPIAPSSPEIPSSPDTVDQKSAVVEDVAEPPRILELEPWVWVNTLIAGLQDLVRFKDVTAASADPWASTEDITVVRRVISDTMYMAAVLPGAQSCESCCTRRVGTSADSEVSILRSTQTDDIVSFQPAGSQSILAVAFFDDLELALLLQTQAGERYLATIAYTKIIDWRPVQSPRNSEELVIQARQNVSTNSQTPNMRDFQANRHQVSEPPPFARIRYLKTVDHSEEDEQVSIALNGRPGRRVGCVIMGDGKEVEVLDMDQDEDAEEDDEEGEEDVDMSGITEV